jgi:pimeloyl-ACP methyl ester carboxylesterase
MNPLVIFAHGKESGPWGSKIQHLAQIARRHGAEVISPDYSQFGDPDDRVRHLSQMTIVPHDGLILVGSSMGGYVSTIVSQTLKPVGLFLMAPAFYLDGYSNQAPTSGAAQTMIVTGWRDEVIPAEHSIRFAQQHRAVLHLLDSDHRLNDVLPQVGELFDMFLGQVLSELAVNKPR